MSLFCNYNIPIFPMNFGALTFGTGGFNVFNYGFNLPLFDFSANYTYNNPFTTVPITNNSQPIFNFNNITSTPDCTSTTSSSSWSFSPFNWFNNFSSNMPTFSFSNMKFDFSSAIMSSPSGDTFTRTYTGTLQNQLVERATSYIGRVNSDAEGNRLFSPGGKTQNWCADFVTSVTKATYGNKLPASFGSSGVANLQSWAKSNNCYIATDNKSSSNRKDFIAKNIKPGDIMIEQRNGKSHTGIVTKVYSDGSFDTVEGNTSNKVAKRHYSADSSSLSGFINLDKYSA